MPTDQDFAAALDALALEIPESGPPTSATAPPPASTIEDHDFQAALDALDAKEREDDAAARAAAPTAQRMDHLNNLATEMNPEQGQLLDDLRSVFDSPAAGDPGTLSQAAAILEKHNLPAYEAIRTTGRYQLVLRESDAAATAAMKAMGISRTSAHPAAVQKLRAQFQLTSLFIHSPVPESISAKIAQRSLRTLLDGRMAEADAQLTGAQKGGGAVTPEAANETGTLRAIHRRTQDWSETDALDVLKLALSHEHQLERDEPGTGREMQSDFEDRSARIMTNLPSQVLGGDQGTSITNVGIRAGRPDLIANNPRNVLPLGDKAAAVQVFLGADWRKKLLAAYDNEKLQYNLARAGVRIDDTGRVVTGQFTGIDFVDLIPNESMQALLEEAAANSPPETLKAINDEWSTQLPRIKEVYGESWAREFHKAHTLDRLEDVLKYYAQATSVSTAPGGQEGLPLAERTPYERSLIGPGARFGMAVESAWGALFKGAGRLTSAVDKDLSRNETIRRLSQDATYFWTGNTALAETTRGPAHFVTTLFKTIADVKNFDMIGSRLKFAMQRLTGLGKTPEEIRGLAKEYLLLDRPLSDLLDLALGGVRRELKDLPHMSNEQVLADLVGMKGATPERVRAAFDMENQTGELFRSFFDGHFQAEEQRQQRMAAQTKALSEWYLDGKAPTTPPDPLQHMTDAAGSTLFMALVPFVDTMAAMMDDPRQGFSYLMGFDAMGRGFKGVHVAKNKVLDRALQGFMLEKKLVQLAKYAPDQLGTFRDAVTKEIHGYKPGGSERVLNRLRAAEAAIDDVLDDAKAGRFQPSTGFRAARGLRRVWGEIAGELDDAGISLMHKIGTETPIGGFLDFLNQRVFRQIQKPGKWWDFFVSQKYFDVVTQQLDRMLRQDEGLVNINPNTTDNILGMRDNVYQRKVREYRDTHGGQMPTRQQMFEMLPDQTRDLNAALHASDLMGESSPLTQRVFARVLGGAKNVRVFEHVRDKAENILNDAHEAAIAEVEAQKKWGPVRLRGEKIIKTVRNKVRNDVERLTIARDGVTAMRNELSADLADVMEELSPEGSQLSGEALNAEVDRVAPGLRAHLATLEDQIREYDSQLHARSTKKSQIDKTLERLRSHRSRDPWRFPAEPAVLEELDGDLLHEVLRRNPELFSGLRPAQVLKEIHDPGAAKVAAQLRDQIAGVDRKLAGIFDDAMKATGDAAVYDARAKLNLAREQRRALVEQLDAAEHPPVVDRIIDREAVQRNLSPLLKHDGTRASAVVISRAEDARQALVAGRFLGMRGNPFSLAALPFLKKVGALHGLGNSVQARVAAAVMRLEDLAKVYNKMSRGEQRLLARAQRTGILPSELTKKYPTLRRSLDEVERLDTFFQEEQGIFDQVFRAVRRAGMMDDKVLLEMKSLGYDPPLYGVYERPSAVMDSEVTQVARTGRTASQGKPSMTTPAQVPELTELKLRRDVSRWRVRVDEPDRIVDEYFDSAGQADDFIVRNYGASTLNDLTRSGGFRRGQTNFKDRIAVADPLGKEGLKNLDWLGAGSTPLARIKRVKQLWRDVYMKSYVDALNLYGGLVLDEAAWNKLNVKVGAKHATAQFYRVPDNKTYFGALAGKMVHKKVFAEMGAMVRTYEGLDGFLEGIREGFQRSDMRIPTELTTRMLGVGGKTLDGLTTAAKNTQILASWRTWVANSLFNVVLDHMGGFGVYDLRNVRTLVWALRQTNPRNPSMKRDPLYYLAVDKGVIDGGGFFGSGSGSHLREGLQQAVGFGSKDGVRLKALRARRAALLSKNLAETGGKTSKGLNTGELETELAAIDSAMDELNSGFLRRWGRWVAGFFYNRKSPLGQSANKAVELGRAYYNQIDTHFKLAAFKNMVDAGVPLDEAVWRVKTFIQDYGRVPAALRSGNPLLSLVTSFPYELSRLSVNYARHYPARTLGLIAAVGALNMSSMTLAGMNWDRLSEMLEYKGASGDMEKFKYFSTHLMVFDDNRDLVTDVGIGNWIPFVDVITARGIVGVGMDWSMPPERRDWRENVVAGGVGYVGQFVGNNPLFNGLTLMLGRDPVTGELLVDQDADSTTKFQQSLKAFAQNYLPPLFPHVPGTPIVGRDWERVEKAYEGTQALNPKTGRPFRAPAGVMSSVMRAATGADVRGTIPAALDAAAGTRAKGQKTTVADDYDVVLNAVKKTQGQFRNVADADLEEALYSPYTEIRKQYYRMIQEARTPEAKEKAQAEFVRMVKDQRTEAGGAAADKPMTEREAEAFVERIADYDPFDTFGRMSLDEQAYALTRVDRAGVRDPLILELVARMMMTDAATFRGANDPEKVEAAVKMLEQRVSEGDANPRLAWVLRHLKTAVIPEAELTRDVEKAFKPLGEAQKELDVELRKKLIDALTKK